ncbi:regulator of G-protein signaling 3-like [Polyodon spathula]|uniref:regulator of G-protein signaling 3-like n=1 Tax=Polyodon spathula TaxID=7913 RepID=UPI001B7DB17C|nr:regulator of G-protein signaling 3-like [Polyodon spathula]
MEYCSIHRVSLCNRLPSTPNSSFLLRTFGQLKLSISAEDGVIVLHIMEAKGLMGKEYRTCDSYVKMALVPDTDHSSRQKTKTVPDCRIPVFHKLFRFSVKNEDYQKRLLVTVWNRDRSSRKSELLGCMSFGIRSLIAHEKEVVGWYYLLGEELGRTKHLKVSARHRKQRQEAQNYVAHTERRSPQNMDSLTVTILRGKDGYGFTICCDSPVRVQAVDPGGPADQAGLQQLDIVLQLNGQPVEQWKCIELAHTIRNSHSEITVSVWRTVPQIKPGFESLIRLSDNYSPLSPPCKREKNYSSKPVPSEQRQSCHILYNGTDYSSHPVPSEQRQSCHILYHGTDQGSRNGWAQQEQGESKTAHTVQGPRLAASGDQNYILLAPINPGSQILRPVFQENCGTLGRVYRGRVHGGLQRKSTLIGSTTNMSKTPVHALKNYTDYQNCTIVRSHVPHTSYGTYVTLAPKVLIFPVSVQPLDLCNPTRSLVLSEEMILHESNHQSIKVTVFIYTDLMLLTREDELGRCNVLQNPLFLQHLKLQEDSSEGLKFYLIHITEKSDCLLSLESYSEKQKRRVCQCLKESIEKQHQEREPPATEDKMLKPKTNEHGEMASEEERVSGSIAEALASRKLDGENTPEEEKSSSTAPTPATTPTEDSKSMEEDSESCRGDQEDNLRGGGEDGGARGGGEDGGAGGGGEDGVARGGGEDGGRSRGGGEDGGARGNGEDGGAKGGDGNDGDERGEQLETARATFVIPEVRLDWTFSQSADALSALQDGVTDEDEEEEEDDENEGDEDSDENYLERSDSKRHSMIESSACEKHCTLSTQSSLQRRTHSEGSLLQEPKAQCFTSDNALHCLEHENSKSGWLIPSPRTLKKELAKDGGSMHQLYLLFSRRKFPRNPPALCYRALSAGLRTEG